MASTSPEGELPDQAPPSTDTLVITPSQALERTASSTVDAPVESPWGATQHPGNSSSAMMASAAMAADTTQFSSDSAVDVAPSPTVISSVPSPAPQPGTGDAMAMANSTTLQPTVANSTMALADPVMVADSATAMLSSYSPASSSPAGTVVSAETFTGPTPPPPLTPPLPPGNLMALNNTQVPDSTTAALSSYSPASSSPAEAVVSAEASTGPTPPPPLAPPLPPGNLMALNNTQVPPPPPVGLVGLAALSHNSSSHVALNGTSSAPMTQMSMVSPTSVLPVLPTSAVPAASAALSLAGGLSPLTLISLSVGVSAFMFGIGALHGRYADDKKEQ